MKRLARTVLGFARLTLRDLFAGKRAVAAAALGLLPPLVTALAAGLFPQADGTLLFHGIAFHFSLQTMIFLLSLIFGIAVTSGQIEEGTVGYLYLGALPRWAIVLIQVLVGTAALTALAGLSLLLTGLAAGLAGKGAPDDLWRDAGGMTVVAGVGTLASLGFYAACGMAFRRPLAVAIIATFFWEMMITHLPVRFASWTLTNNLRALMLHLVFDGERRHWFRYARNYGIPEYGEAALFLAAVAGVFLAAAMVAASARSIEGKESR